MPRHVPDNDSLVGEERQKNLTFVADYANKGLRLRAFCAFDIRLANHDRFDRNVLDFCIGVYDLGAVEVDLDIFDLRRSLLQRDQAACLAGVGLWDSVSANAAVETVEARARMRIALRSLGTPRSQCKIPRPIYCPPVRRQMTTVGPQFGSYIASCRRHSFAAVADSPENPALGPDVGNLWPRGPLNRPGHTGDRHA
jgi:hypothetical protein